MSPKGFNDFTYSQKHVYHLLFHKRGKIDETAFLCWTKNLLWRMHALAGHMTPEDFRAELKANWFPVIAALENGRETECKIDPLELGPKKEPLEASAVL